ncbi:hypothetical protein BDN72DRAFT_840962, partial [Pluteus cervinus]
MRPFGACPAATVIMTVKTTLQLPWYHCWRPSRVPLEVSNYSQRDPTNSFNGCRSWWHRTSSLQVMRSATRNPEKIMSPGRPAAIISEGRVQLSLCRHEVPLPLHWGMQVVKTTKHARLKSESIHI